MALVLAGMAFAAMPIAAQSPALNGGPGIVMSGSMDVDNLPMKAKKFLRKHFNADRIVKCEREYAESRYEVDLRSGVDIEFSNDGDVVEIDAPDRASLPREAVKEVVGHKIFTRLEKDGYADSVESVDFSKGRVVEIEVMKASPDTYVFDLDGNFVVFED